MTQVDSPEKTTTTMAKKRRKRKKKKKKKKSKKQPTCLGLHGKLLPALAPTPPSYPTHTPSYIATHIHWHLCPSAPQHHCLAAACPASLQLVPPDLNPTRYAPQG